MFFIDVCVVYTLLPLSGFDPRGKQLVYRSVQVVGSGGCDGASQLLLDEGDKRGLRERGTGGEKEDWWESCGEHNEQREKKERKEGKKRRKEERNDGEGK